MNTDNMTISGETIDYGPCAFMDRYDPATCFSSIDRHGRYAYANQPKIAQWNLARLAETLLPLIDTDAQRAIGLASEVIQQFPQLYERHWLHGMRAKLGLLSEEEADLNLANEFVAAMNSNGVDFTLAFRHLAEAALGNDQPLRALFADPSAYDRWREHWHLRQLRETATPTARAHLMRRESPAFIPRNHRVEEALSAAVDQGDYGKFDILLGILANPYEDQAAFAAFAEPPAEVNREYQTFCGT
jgi:uncharacterized protein YdiU (UPF0061 family)